MKKKLWLFLEDGAAFLLMAGILVTFAAGWIWWILVWVLSALRRLWIWLAFIGYVFVGVPAIIHEIKPTHKFAWLIYLLVFLGCLVLAGAAFLSTFKKGCEKFNECFERFFY